MHGKAPPQIVLAAWIVMAQASAAWSAESKTAPVRDGDPCNETSTYISKTDGIVTGSRLAGRVLRTNVNGDLQGVHPASLYLAHFNPADWPPPVLTGTNRQGHFLVVVPVWYSDTKWCRNGVVVTERSYGDVDIVVKAKGCQDLELKLSPEKTGQSWGMKCETPGSG